MRRIVKVGGELSPVTDEQRKEIAKRLAAPLQQSKSNVTHPFPRRRRWTYELSGTAKKGFKVTNKTHNIIVWEGFDEIEARTKLVEKRKG